MGDLAKHVFETGRILNRVAAASARESTMLPSPIIVHTVSLGDRVLGIYRKEERAIVVAHQIRQSEIYAGLTWQKTSHAYTGRQVWTCDVHGETITLTIEPRQVE